MPIKEASIVSPVNGNRLWNCLDGYHNRAFIADGFRRGFFIGMPHNNNVPVNNYSNANPKPAKNRQVMIDKLNVELKAGRTRSNHFFQSRSSHVAVIVLLRRPVPETQEIWITRPKE